MKFSFNFLIVITLILAAFLQSCKEDECPCVDETNPECDNYNPCWDKKPVTADFEMSTKWAVDFPDYIGQWHPDIAFERGRIGFQPIGYDEDDTTVKYTWLLGNEVIHNYSFVRDFEDTKQTGENNIRMTLIVEKEPNLDCFPLDDGKDSVVKYIKLVDDLCDFTTVGDFKVLFEEDSDSVIFQIRNWKLATYTTVDPDIIDSCDGNWVNSVNLVDAKYGFDTIWNTSFIAKFNSKFWFTKSIGGGVIGYPYNGYFYVNPENWDCEGEYQVLLGLNSLSETIKFKGRKIR